MKVIDLMEELKDMPMDAEVKGLVQGKKHNICLVIELKKSGDVALVGNPVPNLDASPEGVA